MPRIGVIKHDIITSTGEVFTEREEVYEYVESTDATSLSVGVTRKTGKPPVLEVPLDAIRWAGEWDTFANIKAKIDAARLDSRFKK